MTTELVNHELHKSVYVDMFTAILNAGGGYGIALHEAVEVSTRIAVDFPVWRVLHNSELS